MKQQNPILPKLEDSNAKISELFRNGEYEKAFKLFNAVLYLRYGFCTRGERNDDGSVSVYTVGDS
jgi:hypothetical protein